MKIKIFENMDTTSNTYVVSKDKNIYVIDPGSYDMKNVISYLEENKLELTAILLTHGHYDHIAGIPKILEYKNVPVYISKIEEEFLYNPNYSLLNWYIVKQSEITESLAKTEVKLLEENQIFDDFKIIHTPGHTHGGICFYNENEKILISGDTIFKGTYGRTDLPTGNSMEMSKSISKLLKLPIETVVYPGHGLSTTIKEEIKTYEYY